jgi:hypothetical protein
MFGLLFSPGSFWRIAGGGGTGAAVDELAPPAPSLDLAASSDLGQSDTDDLTADSTPLVYISTSDVWVEDDEVRFRVDGGAATTPYVVTAGEVGGDPIEQILDALTDGVHTIQARHNRPNAGDHWSPWSSSLTVTIETTAPTILALSPLDNAVDVAVGATLTAQFSEDVFFAATVDLAVYDASDDSLIEAFDETDIGVGISITDDTLTINLTSDLDNSTEYYVQIDAGSIEGEAGNAFAGITDETTWSFTTEASALVTRTIASSGMSIIYQGGSRTWVSAGGVVNVES